MEMQTIISFIVSSMLLTIMPGPDNILVLTESISRGKTRGILLSAGFSSGLLIHTLFAVTGISLIIKNSEILFSILRFGGIAYLLYLAWKALVDQSSVANNRDPIDTNAFGLFRKGLILNVMNPKVLLFFIAFLPQFVKQESTIEITFQIIIFGIIFMLQAFGIFSLIAILSSPLNNLLNESKNHNWVRYVNALLLFAIATSLIFFKMN